jgi:hypothetical protein
MIPPFKDQASRIAALRQQIAELHAQDLSWSQMAETLGMCPKAIGYHGRALGLKAKVGNPNFGAKA